MIASSRVPNHRNIPQLFVFLRSSLSMAAASSLPPRLQPHRISASAAFRAPCPHPLGLYYPVPLSRSRTAPRDGRSSSESTDTSKPRPSPILERRAPVNTKNNQVDDVLETKLDMKIKIITDKRTLDAIGLHPNTRANRHLGELSWNIVLTLGPLACCCASFVMRSSERASMTLNVWQLQVDYGRQETIGSAMLYSY